MDRIETTNGALTVGRDGSIAFAAADGPAARAGRVVRPVLWDCACQREWPRREFACAASPLGRRGAAFRYALSVPEAFFSVEWEIEPRGDGFLLSFFPETLVEERRHMYRLMALDVLPGFFGARPGDPGWFLLPNYCGAVMRFDREREFEARDMIYGEQCDWERMASMPVCGVSRGTDGWMAIVRGGRFDARVVTAGRRDGDGRLFFEQSPSFVLRHAKTDPVSGERREVEYVRFAGGAGWDAMARRYREHLLRERGVRPLEERMKGNPALSYAASSTHCKIFHGMKLSRLADGDEEMTVTATFEETAEIARAMKKAGVERCVFILVGWNPEGHDGMYPSRFPIEPRLGGEEGFRRLGAVLRELDYRLSVHDNHTDWYMRSPLAPLIDPLIDRDGEIVGGSHWGGGVARRVCPATMPSAKSLLDLARMKEKGVDGIYYLDAMPSPLFPCFSPAHPAGRREYAEGLRRLTAAARGIFGAVTTEGYLDYIAEDLDMAWHVPPPLRELVRFDEKLSYIDELVPFYQVAFHGLLLYHAGYEYGYAGSGLGTDAAVALEAALGALPMNEVAFGEEKRFYVPAFREHTEAMGRHHRVLCGTLADRQTRFIERIDRDPAARVYETVYDDGRRIVADLSAGRLEIA